jgi:hypothetical protein
MYPHLPDHFTRRISNSRSLKNEYVQEVQRALAFPGVVIKLIDMLPNGIIATAIPEAGSSAAIAVSAAAAIRSVPQRATLALHAAAAAAASPQCHYAEAARHQYANYQHRAPPYQVGNGYYHDLPPSRYAQPPHHAPHHARHGLPHHQQIQYPQSRPPAAAAKATSSSSNVCVKSEHGTAAPISSSSLAEALSNSFSHMDDEDVILGLSADMMNDDFLPTTNEESFTQYERHVMASLRQMGFDNPVEIKQAIRACGSASVNNVSADDCMMWIIHQREEQVEARKMDTARMRSEELRQEAATARKAAARDIYQTANSRVALQRIFGTTSVVLAEVSSSGDADKDKDTVKDKQETPQNGEDFLLILKEIDNGDLLYKFLQLEQNIYKWYNDVSWCYLTDLVKGWKKTWNDVGEKKDATHEHLKIALRTATKQLEQGMYSLEHQQGGIPKLFWEKKQEAERLGLPTGPANSNSNKEDNKSDEYDDDLVEVLESPPAKKHKTSGGSDEKSGGSNNASIVVIDISD